MQIATSSIFKACLLLLSLLIAERSDAQFLWEELDSPLSIEFKCGFFMDNDHAIAVGEDGTLIHTEDGGLHWTGQQDKEMGGFWTAAFKQGGSFAIAAGDNGLVMSSTDYGDSWTVLDTILPVGSFLFGSQIVDENTFYLAGGKAPASGVVMKTTDGGKNWQTLMVPGMFFLDRIVFRNDLLGLTCGSTAAGGGKILKTTNGGTSWTPIYETDKGFVTSIQCPTDQHFYATVTLLSGDGGLLLRSTDSGATWGEQMVSEHELISNFFTDEDHGYACGTGVILYTSNGGMQWTDAGYTGLENINYVQAFNGKAFGVGTSGTLIKYDPEASVARNTSPTSSVYPNPAKSHVRITVPYAELKPRLLIYDVLGRVVYDAAVEQEEIVFERGHLPNGIYYYYLTSPDDLRERGSFVFE